MRGPLLLILAHLLIGAVWIGIFLMLPSHVSAFTAAVLAIGAVVSIVVGPAVLTALLRRH